MLSRFHRFNLLLLSFGNEPQMWYDDFFINEIEIYNINGAYSCANAYAKDN